MKFPDQMLSQGQLTIDVIFVSPLSRALCTATHMLKIHKLSFTRIIVLPDLTEVLSKICDFSGDIEHKIANFPLFDFH